MRSKNDKCIDCAKELEDESIQVGRRRCTPCYQLKSNAARDLRNAITSQSKCQGCLCDVPAGAYKCDICLKPGRDESKAKRIQWATDGVCQSCGHTVEADRIFKNGRAKLRCEYCSRQESISIGIRRRERKEKGLCHRCGKVPDNASLYKRSNQCMSCQKKRIKWQVSLSSC